MVKTVYNKSLMRIVISIGGILVGLLGVFYYFMFLGFAEKFDMKAGSLSSRLLIPLELREAKTGRICHPVRYSRWINECGGVCGESFLKHWGTPLSLDEVEDIIDRDALSRTLTAEFLKLSVDSEHPDASAGCAIASLHISVEF